MTEQNSLRHEEDQAPAGSPSEPTREWLLQQLRRVLEIALDKVTNPKTAPPDRIKWSRIVIAAGASCNSVLRDVEIDELRREIMELKALTRENEEGEDENRSNQAGDREAPEEN